jgi:hypothetical protein
METVTKIDIISDNIYCYDELNNTREIYPLTSEYNFFINEFSDTQELLTVNITDPIARIMKFYTIENSIPKSFTELDYVDMIEEQKIIFNTFVDMIKTK